MNELTTTNNGLSVSKNEVQHVLQNQPAFLQDFNSVYNEVLAHVVKSFNHVGFRLPEKKEMDLLINEVTTSIQTNYKTLRKEEISTAFAKGIRGEYGEFMGLSVVSFEKFIIGYLASDYRANLGKTLPAAELPAPSKELTRQDRIDFAKIAFEKFKQTGYYNDLGNIVYAFLDSEKLIPFTTPEKFEMLEEARKAEYARLQNPLSVHEARRFNIEIEGLINSNEKIIPQSKRIALNRYFKRLQTGGLELVFAENPNSQTTQL